MTPRDSDLVLGTGHLLPIRKEQGLQEQSSVAVGTLHNPEARSSSKRQDTTGLIEHSNHLLSRSQRTQNVMLVFHSSQITYMSFQMSLWQFKVSSFFPSFHELLCAKLIFTTVRKGMFTRLGIKKKKSFKDCKNNPKSRKGIRSLYGGPEGSVSKG